jgi:pyruvate dehydrogenase E2 component (dihydrolipoamide acetyltransferase)
MTIEFKLPDIGEGVAEGEIVQWLVKAGDAVKEFQPIVEVMTDKATVEIPSPADGTIGELRAEAGDVVPVGDVIFTLEGGGAPAAAPAAPAPAAAAPAPAAAPPAPAAPAPAPAAPAPVASDAKVLAVPSARRVARELGVDLGQVAGTGRNGVVRRSDVEAFHASGAAAPAAAGAPAAVNAGGETRRPFRGVRRKIAEAMVQSYTSAVHFTLVEEVDVTELVALREEAKAIGAREGIKVTYMPFIMKAVANGLMRFPVLNGHLDEAAGEIVNPNYVNLGIATDTPNGLIVPVIRDVQAKGILQLAAELGELAERTREGKVKPDELKGSTFSITNAGNIGGTLATPIINFPDIAILGVHRLMKRPGVVETPEGDVMEVRQYMNFSCSVDHRLADGADAARFLAWLRTLLENPGLIAL